MLRIPKNEKKNTKNKHLKFSRRKTINVMFYVFFCNSNTHAHLHTNYRLTVINRYENSVSTKAFLIFLIHLKLMSN